MSEFREGLSRRDKFINDEFNLEEMGLVEGDLCPCCELDRLEFEEVKDIECLTCDTCEVAICIE